MSLQRCVGERGDGAGVGIARVRRDCGENGSGWGGRRGMRQHVVDHGGEFFGISGIKGTGDRGAAHLLREARRKIFEWRGDQKCDERSHEPGHTANSLGTSSDRPPERAHEVPDTGDWMQAVRTRAVLADEQTVSRKARALHYYFAALRAVCVLCGMAGDVADIDKVKSFCIGDGLGALQRFTGVTGRFSEDIRDETA